MHKNRPGFKSVIALFTLFVGTLGAAGCNPNSSRPPTSMDNTSQTINAPGTTTKEEIAMTTETSENKTGVFIEPTQSRSKANTTKAAGAGTTISPTQTGGTKAVQHAFAIKLAQYHPGVPGYDVTYQLIGTYEGLLINVADYSLSCNLPGVRINGNNVTVPYAVRQTGQTLCITGTYLNQKKYTYKLDIALKPWTKTLDEDFSTATLNPDLWSTFRKDFNRTDSPDVRTAEDATYIKNGRMVLEPKKQAYKDVNHISAAVSTEKKFTQIYGCFTARIKMPDKGGILSAFWLLPPARDGREGFFTLPDKDTRWLCSEIDIVEHWASAGNKSQHTEHFWGESGGYLGQCAAFYEIPDFKANEFYEYSLVWTKYALYYYVDGVLVKTKENDAYKNPSPAHIVFSAYPAPNRCIMNETINGTVYNYNGWYGFMQESDYGTTMEVDFLRVYK